MAPSTTSESIASSTPTSVPQPSQGLSTGAKAGIGAGVAVAVVGLLCLGFLFFRRQRKQRYGAQNMAPSPVYEAGVGTVHEMHHAQAPARVVHKGPLELESRQK